MPQIKKILIFLVFTAKTATSVFAQSGTGSLDKTIADYTEALRLNPNDAEAYNNRGIAYTDKGEYDRAIADCTEAIRLNPNLAEAYIGRGVTYCYKGNYSRARADWEKVLQIDPNNASARNMLEQLRKDGY